MADDIVDRLRNGRGGLSLLSEAADEIERLRVELDKALASIRYEQLSAKEQAKRAR